MNKYKFKLYIAGEKEEDDLLIKKLEDAFRKEQNTGYDLNIIDVVKNPTIAEEDKILIIPTLIKIFPLPEKKIFGDLNNIKDVLAYLDFPEKNQERK